MERSSLDPVPRLAWWFGVIFAPWIFLAFCILVGVVFGSAKHGSALFDLAYLMVFYPFAGLPILWTHPGHWLKKFALSVFYVLGCYGLPVLVVFVTVFMTWKD